METIEPMEEKALEFQDTAIVNYKSVIMSSEPDLKEICKFLGQGLVGHPSTLGEWAREMLSRRNGVNAKVLFSRKGEDWEVSII